MPIPVRAEEHYLFFSFRQWTNRGTLFYPRQCTHPYTLGLMAVASPVIWLFAPTLLQRKANIRPNINKQILNVHHKWMGKGREKSLERRGICLASPTTGNGNAAWKCGEWGMCISVARKRQRTWMTGNKPCSAISPRNARQKLAQLKNRGLLRISS